MPIFNIHHLTKYEYDRQVTESINEIKIFPSGGRDQEVLRHDLFITGNPPVHLFADYWENKTGTFSLLPAHKILTIDSKLTVRTTAPDIIRTNFESGFAELEEEVADNIKMLELSAPDKIEARGELETILSEIYHPGKSVAATVGDCCQYIYDRFDYIKGITDVETTVDEILSHRAGVCQDFAHLMLQVLRTLKVPVRYVSGYICPNKNGMRGEGATHAWIEAWIPGSGWTGIDPTNNVWVTNRHVKLSVGRNFKDCSPVKGTFKGPAEQKLSVYVSVGYEDGHIAEALNDVRTNLPLGEYADVTDGIRMPQQ